MAIRKNTELTPEQLSEVANRFGIAQDEPQPEDIHERLMVQLELRELIYSAAKYMTRRISNTRERFKALEKLEEALMWGGKAIFKKDGE